MPDNTQCWSVRLECSHPHFLGAKVPFLGAIVPDLAGIGEVS